ncbi:hypothetical protein CEXT_503821 [Caerostris extrusa]|uniref:Uncharacterized protein n=1 Tax=Caerostris extrusa TaxID=172846 RepID=A0AAV4VYL6_CAEEX|nr:hypothetical protein CEXT_503821 [Caerostris extrusa]
MHNLQEEEPVPPAFRKNKKTSGTCQSTSISEADARGHPKRRTAAEVAQQQKMFTHNLLLEKPKCSGKINYHWDSELSLDEFPRDPRSTKACSLQDKASGPVWMSGRYHPVVQCCSSIF